MAETMTMSESSEARRRSAVPGAGDMRGARILLAASLLSLAACGGPDSGAAAGQGGTGGAGGAGGGGGAVSQPPGTTDPSSSSGSATLEIGANAGPGGTLYFNDRPALGEPTISGLVLVQQGHGPPPADTVATLNGVALVHAVLGGTPSQSYFTVDPGGPQPTIAPDGFLHLTASSASAGATRLLHLACPFAAAVTPTPAAGSSLSGLSTVRLDWTQPLPVNPSTSFAFGLVPASASLLGYDAGTRALSGAVGTLPLGPAALEASLTVGTTAASGFVAELRYPGIFFLDGETGGACGRTQRFIYSK
jgi:hypothetical protein